METKNIEMILEERDNNDILSITIKHKEYIINLNSEDQTQLRTFFTAIIENLFEHKINIELKINEAYKNMMFIEIAQEYVKCLNEEIENIFNDLPEL